MKEMMTILDGSTFRTALRRVHRELPADSFVLVENNNGTVTAVRHDVAVMRNIDRRVKYLPKPSIHFYSFQELVGEALHRGFSHVSINEGDGWSSRLPIEDMVRGYIPRQWREFKFRFYRKLHSHWSESLTLYPSSEGDGFFYHVKELF